MKYKKVSIIMSTFNDEKYIMTAIDSVINQTFTNWEFIIINDASTDQTTQILKKIARKETRIKLIENRYNNGLTVNLNLGISESKGEYIARIDGDDIWIDRNKLKKQVTFMDKNTDYGLVGTYAIAINEKGKKLFELSYPYTDREIRDTFLRQNCFIHSSLLIRRKTLEEVKLYNMRYEFAQDYDMCLKIGTISKVGNIPEYMVNYMMNPRGTSMTKYRQQIKDTLHIIKVYREKYPNFLTSFLIWNIRMYYPDWVKGGISRSIKKKLSKKGKIV